MLLSRFLHDRKASVAPLLAIAIIPLVGFVGAAVDYGRASSVRVSMQAAIDSTALMLSKTASTMTVDQLTQSATNIFNANFNRPEAQNVKIAVVYDQKTGGSKINITGSASVPTNFMGILGFQTLDVGSTSTVTWGVSRLRVALALDNTGSMSSSGKMDALKTASHNLLKQLKDAAQTDGDVYVSIVPFSKDVNVGASNYAAEWIDWSLWEEDNGTCSNNNYKTKSSCLSHSKIWTAKNHNIWNGCVTDRDQNYDTMNTTPMAGALFPAEQYSSCPTQIMPLSYDWAALNSKIDAMSPNGTTNQAIGLVWGWQSLSPTSPLNAPAEDPNYQYQKVVILLSDGQNTENRFSSTQSVIDARQQIACDNMKAAGITIYTILVMAGNSTVLQNCATDASKYFALTDANQMITTFNKIGTNLAKLHIMK